MVPPSALRGLHGLPHLRLASASLVRGDIPSTYHCICQETLLEGHRGERRIKRGRGAWTSIFRVAVLKPSVLLLTQVWKT
jgi:hypothetical protein